MSVPATIHETSQQWLLGYLRKHYPQEPPDTVIAQYARSAPLLAVQVTLTAALAAGDPAATTQAARAWCLAWIAVLKTHTPLDPVPGWVQESVPPLPVSEDTAFRRWHSAILETDFVVCELERDALALAATGTVAYAATEVRLLARLKAQEPGAFPERLRWLHNVKQTFGGLLVAETVTQAAATIPLQKAPKKAKKALHVDAA